MGLSLATHTAMSLILRLERNVSYSGKLGSKGSPRGNASRRVSVKLAIGGRATHTERLHVAARAVSPITVVKPHRISRKGKVRHANRFFEPVPKPARLPHLRAVVSDHGAAAGGSDAGGLARRRYMVCVQPVKFDVQVIRVDTFLWCQLHSIRQRIVPILH